METRTHPAAGRLTLGKTDAELEATGLYIPSTQKQGHAGDTFAFVGTEMTHVPYVVDAEKRVDDNKKDVIQEKGEIRPTIVVTTDRVRISNFGNAGALIDSLKAGNTIRIADKRLTNGVTETLYLQSVTYKFRDPSSEDAALNPDVEIVLGNEYAVSASPITMMQGEISALQKQVGSISNVEQIVRRVGDKTYLRKDVNDIAAGAIKFLEQSKHVKGVQFGNTYTPGSVGGVVDENANAELLTLIVRQFLSSANFRNGLTGEGWKLWMEDGLAKMELDELTVRQVMHVFELVIDKVRAVGGQIVVSAANGKVKYVEDNEDTYRIYFDGDNYFQPNDLMRCQTFTGNDIRGYWVEIAGTGIDYVDVPKSEFENGVVPKEGDEVVLMGNTTNDKRQNLISISATEDKQPRIDILDGVHEKNFAGCLRTRLGNLDGIQDPWFGDNQPHGDGLYADNAYLKGTFLLTTGEDIKTKFEIVEGKITSEIEGLRGELSDSRGLLRNASFVDGFDYWDVAPVGYNAFTLGSVILWSNNNILGVKGSGVFFIEENGKRILQIIDDYISQDSTHFLNIPEFKTNDKGKKVPATVYVSFMYKVVEAGQLGFGIVDQEGEDFENYEYVYYNKSINQTEDYKQLTFPILWDGTGCFEFSFYGGEIRIYGLTLSTNEADTLEYRYKTLFEQSANLIRLSASVYGEDKTLLKESGLVVKAEGAGIYSQGPDGNVALIGATVVEETGETVVKLTGDNIKLEGYTTINKNFHIDDNGNAQMKNATVEGEITATSGKIGDFSIKDGNIIGGTQGLIQVGSENFNNVVGAKEEIKILKLQHGVTAPDITSTTCTYRTNNATTLVNHQTEHIDWNNIAVVNAVMLDYFTRYYNDLPSNYQNRYGFQYAMLGSGHVCMDGIVEGMCVDFMKFKGSRQVQIITPPMWCNRICVNSYSYTDCVVILPDKFSMFSCMGCGIINNEETRNFTFRIDIMNIGTNSIYVSGNCKLDVDTGSGLEHEYPFQNDNYPTVYDNAGNSYANKATTKEYMSIKPNTLKGFMLMFDGINYKAFEI